MSWMSGEDGGTCVMRMPPAKHIGEAPANTLCLDISLEPSAFRALPGKDRARPSVFARSRRSFAERDHETPVRCRRRRYRRQGVYAELNSGGFDADRLAPRRLPATQNPTGAQRQAKHGAAIRA